MTETVFTITEIAPIIYNNKEDQQEGFTFTCRGCFRKLSGDHTNMVNRFTDKGNSVLVEPVAENICTTCVEKEAREALAWEMKIHS